MNDERTDSKMKATPREKSFTEAPRSVNKVTLIVIVFFALVVIIGVVLLVAFYYSL